MNTLYLMTICLLSFGLPINHCTLHFTEKMMKRDAQGWKNPLVCSSWQMDLLTEKVKKENINFTIHKVFSFFFSPSLL